MGRGHCAAAQGVCVCQRRRECSAEAADVSSFTEFPSSLSSWGLIVRNPPDLQPLTPLMINSTITVYSVRQRFVFYPSCLHIRTAPSLLNNEKWMRSREPFCCRCCCFHVCLGKVIGNFLCQISFNYFSGKPLQRCRRSVCGACVCVCDLFSGQMIAVSFETRIENKNDLFRNQKWAARAVPQPWQAALVSVDAGPSAGDRWKRR